MQANQLLNIAIQDIKSCAVLYKAAQYPNSLFYFQQSVEKSIKSIGLTMGSISEEQLQKDIRHDPTKVFAKMFDHIANNSNGLQPPFDAHEITKAKQVIMQGSEQDAVDAFKNYMQGIIKQPKLIDESISPFEAVCNYVSKALPNLDLGHSDPLFRSYAEVRLKKQTEEMILLVNYGTRIMQLLMGYALLLSKYKVDDFRYPSIAYGDPNEYFNEQNPLVENLPLLIMGMDSLVLKFTDKIPWKQSNL